ncbi:unnamed protein product [Mytilus edulis]|uniref:Uncharacterized protein n=1 Tax=Mytilus edulis TaxID=6550 RepID=A0A8S3R2F9_MYTED|nr:unnamed protein product [Mytilus edulis]
MNMCIYAKVILARSTKDPDNLKWWNNKQVENSKENSIYKTVPNHSQNISVFKRYNNYHVIMNRYPKMYIPLAEFKSRFPRVQIYLTKTKYWKNCNKSGEKTLFIEKYNLTNWCKLSEIERKGHQQQDCNICKSDAFHTSLHAASAPQTTNDIDQLCTELTTTVYNTSKTNNDGKMIKVVKTIVPYIEKKTGSNFTDVICKNYKLTPKLTSGEKEKEIKSVLSKQKEEMSNLINADNKIKNFLASSKSYSEYERERLGTFFISKSKAKQNLAKRFREEHKKIKNRKSIGNINNYEFDKKKFINEIKSLPAKSNINWTELSRNMRSKTLIINFHSMQVRFYTNLPNLKELKLTNLMKQKE